MLGLGLREEVRGADVCEHPPGDTGQEAERAPTGCGKGHYQRRGSRYRQPERDCRPHDPGPPEARGHQDGREGDPNWYLVNEDPEPDEPGRDGSSFGTHAENEAVGEVVDG